MTLRGRLLLAYGYLVGLILLASGVAIVGFVGLSEGIEVVLKENFASIDACMRMLGALERQDSVTLAVLLDDPARAAELEPLEKEFGEALDEAEGNITEENEPRILQAIRSEYTIFQQRRDELIENRPDRPLVIYESEVFPRFTNVRQQVRTLLDINHDAMVKADHEARAKAIRNGAALAFLVTIALMSFILLSRALQTRILARLAALQADIASVGSGDLDRRLHEAGADELTTIARHVNALLDRLRAQQAGSRARLSLERQLTLGLLREIGHDVSLYSLSGDLLAGDRIAEHNGGGELVRWIRDEGQRRVESPASAPPTENLDAGPTGLQVHLLTAPPSRPVAWLVRRR